MTPFNSKQFEIKREDQAIARWTGSKDDVTLVQLLELFRKEKWRGQLVISYSGNGGISDIIFTERKVRKIVEDREDMPYSNKS